MFIVFLILWAFVGIGSIILAEVVDPEETQRITLSDLLLVLLLGSLFGGFWIVYLLCAIYDRYKETIQAAFNGLNIVIWERKQ